MKKVNNIAIIIFGVLALVAIPICMWGTTVFNAEFVRWKGAIIVDTAETAHSLQTGDDVVIVSRLPQDMEKSREGFALYQEWTLKLPVGESKKKWHLTDSYKPGFKIMLDGQPITIRATRAEIAQTDFYNVGYDLQYEGIEPGSEITIFGQVTSTDDHTLVTAEMICAADRDECMKEYSAPTYIMVIISVVLALSGIGLIWLGIKKLRS